MVAGGRSEAETSGSRMKALMHPGGMPDICDPSRGRFETAVLPEVFARCARPTSGYPLASFRLAKTNRVGGGIAPISANLTD